MVMSMISPKVIFNQWLAKGTLRQLKRLRSVMYSRMPCKKEVTQRIKELQLDHLQRLIRNKTDDTIITSRHGKKQAYAPVLKIEKFIRVETPRKGFKEFKRVLI